MITDHVIKCVLNFHRQFRCEKDRLGKLHSTQKLLISIVPNQKGSQSSWFSANFSLQRFPNQHFSILMISKFSQDILPKNCSILCITRKLSTLLFQNKFRPVQFATRIFGFLCSAITIKPKRQGPSSRLPMRICRPRP